MSCSNLSPCHRITAESSHDSTGREQERLSCTAFITRITDGTTRIQRRPNHSAGGNSGRGNRGCFTILQHPKRRDNPHLQRHQEQCQPQRVRHHLHGLKREHKGTRAHRNLCSPLKGPLSRPRSSTDYRARAKEVPLNITQKQRPGLRAFLRAPNAQEVHYPARRHATSPPLQIAQRDDRLRHCRPLKQSRSCRKVGGWTHKLLVKFRKSWRRRWDEYVQSALWLHR